MTEDAYIPNAHDATVGWFGRAASGSLRCYCITCNDKHPLASYGPGGTTGPDRIYGDLYVASGERNRVDEGEACDACGVTFLALSEMCQREHDEQQARWAREPVTALVEYGVRAGVRCRIY